MNEFPISTFDLDIAIYRYFDHLVQDFRNWRARSGCTTEWDAERIQEYSSALTTNRGRNYLKVVSERAVHSFIVIKETKGFQIGDILKAASWAAPATNFARGNIFKGDYKDRVTWTVIV